MGKAQRIKAQNARERIAAQQAAARRAETRRKWLMAGGAAVVVIAVVIGVVIFATHKNAPTASRQVIPPGVGGGPPTVQAAAHQIPNTSGIPGVTQYVTTGWPTRSNNGPASQALAHDHVNGPVTYSVTPPVGGQHNATWMNCGIYTEPVPSERAVHNLEHGAVWITYQPSLPKSEVTALRAFVEKQSIISPGGAGRSRYMDLTPYPGLPSPIVLSSWGNQLKVSSPSDPRMQQFVNKFRASQTYSPEYGGPCTGGVGTPAQT
ncbi:MAG: DUF3105 domain-containing protein [Actinobacteria bacterium]|nr:DUF3105 domain-containing protein [Actinomycetota bacterium]